MKQKSKKVIVAMSGGVDSSVTAFLLQKEGYEVMGVFMRLGVDQGSAETSARQVCHCLRIKFYPFNIAPSFKKKVINYFTESYDKGITPNPCVNCNKFIKFGELLKLSDELGADYLATGHYVRKIKNYKLLKGIDETKDQSYFLYNLTQEQLARILFPLGDCKKKDIKKIAKINNLPVQSSESQDICFLSGDHNDFLKEKINLKPGKIVELLPLIDGETERGRKELGKHKGLPLYTRGQRRGVDIGGTGPYYVVRADYKKNILYVSKDRDDNELYSKEFLVTKVNWISDQDPKRSFECEAVIRYRHKPIRCVVKKTKIEEEYIVKLKKAERAITSGQSVVFYDDEEVLGGGVIEIKD